MVSTVDPSPVSSPDHLASQSLVNPSNVVVIKGEEATDSNRQQLTPPYNIGRMKSTSTLPPSLPCTQEPPRTRCFRAKAGKGLSAGAQPWLPRARLQLRDCRRGRRPRATASAWLPRAAAAFDICRGTRAAYRPVPLSARCPGAVPTGSRATSERKPPGNAEQSRTSKSLIPSTSPLVSQASPHRAGGHAVPDPTSVKPQMKPPVGCATQEAGRPNPAQPSHHSDFSLDLAPRPVRAESPDRAPPVPTTRRDRACPPSPIRHHARSTHTPQAASADDAADPVTTLTSEAFAHVTRDHRPAVSTTDRRTSRPEPEHVPRRELAELTGSLQFVAPVLHSGSTFLRAFYDAVHGLDLDVALRPKDYDALVPLPDGFWASFDSYKRILSDHSGTRLFRGDWITLVRQWTDASKTGVGISRLDNDEHGKPLTELQFLAGVWPQRLQLNSSNWRELRTIHHSLQLAVREQRATGRRKLDGACLYVYTDNAVSASVINRGTSSSPSLLSLVKGIREYEAILGCHVVAVWMPGSSEDAFSIVSQGTDGLSRQRHDEGAFAPNAPTPLTFSPIDQASPMPEAALVDAVMASLPGQAIHLPEPGDWYQQPHPMSPAVLTPPSALGRQAIDQVLRWAAAHPYTTGVALILPNNYAHNWGRLAKYFTHVYFARAGQFRRPAAAMGTMVVLYSLPYLDPSHARATYDAGPEPGDPLPDLSAYAKHLDPSVRCALGDAHHPQTWTLTELNIKAPPQLPQELLRLSRPDTAHCRGQKRPAIDRPFGPFRQLTRRAARALEELAYGYLLRQDAQRAVDLIAANVRDQKDRAQWRARIAAVVLHHLTVDRSRPHRSRMIFFRLPYYLWSEVAFGIVPALTSVPNYYNRRNYETAKHQAVYDEFDRLQALGYVSGPLDEQDRKAVHSVMPLGAVPKKDVPEPRVVVDGTMCGLNNSTAGLKFKYPTFNDLIALAYPGVHYWKLDWKDAFFTVRVHPAFRRFFAYKHPRSGSYHHYNVTPFGWKLSPLYYTRLVHAYVDLLRDTPRFTGKLVINHDNHPQHHRSLPALYHVREDGQLATSLDQYCDDGVGFSPSPTSGRTALRQAAALVNHLGAIPKVSKTVPPTQYGEEVLGLGLDSRGGELSISIPPARLQKLKEQMAAFERHRQ